MRRIWWAAGLVGGLLAVAQTRPADRDSGIQRLDPVVLQAPDKDVPKGKDAPKGKDVPPGKDTPPAKEPEAPAVARTDLGGEAPPRYFSRMMGDYLGGAYATQFVVLPGYQLITQTNGTTTTSTHTVFTSEFPTLLVITQTIASGKTTKVVPVLVLTQAQVPILGYGAFKITENEGVLPEERFILTFNGFSGVPAAFPPVPSSVSGGAFPPTVVTAVVIPGRPARNAPAPAVIGGPTFGQLGGPAVFTTATQSPSTTAYREVIGFEKTILDGQASVGVRAPFFQQEGDGSLGRRDFGDLTFVFKYLAWADGPNAVSGGLAVTAPTGPAVVTPVGNIHSTLIQPFVGGRVGLGNAFATGFTSVVVPVDSRDTTMLFNDLQLGFLLYQGGPNSLVSFVAPVTEAHVTTPLGKKHGLVYVPELVALTQGVQIGFGPAELNLGVSIPVTGPKPFDWEGVVQLNFRY